MVKNRPALILREMPRFGDLLVCGISSQLWVAVADFDETITAADSDFERSGLLAPSVVRLGFLAVLPRKSIPGIIGSIAPERHRRLLLKLGNYLTKESQPIE
jgi:mRNA interferase MazF